MRHYLDGAAVCACAAVRGTAAMEVWVSSGCRVTVAEVVAAPSIRMTPMGDVDRGRVRVVAVGDAQTNWSIGSL
jgi:hypothetical protein